MKKFLSLFVAVICVAIMIGGWVWLFVVSSAPGSYTFPLIPPLIIVSIALFIAAMIHIEKFFKLIKTKALEPPKELPEKKNYKALAGMIIQIAMIIALAIWLLCNPIGIIFSLPAFVVFTGLVQGASLCEKIFRGKSISDAPPLEELQNHVPDPIVEPPQNFIAEKNCEIGGAKNYRALVGVILRGAAMVGMWLYYTWLDRRATGMGSLGIIAIFPFALAFSAVLFAGAVLRICDYQLSVRWARGDVTADTPQVKSRKDPVSIAIQSLLIFIAVAVLFGLVGFWPDVAIIAVFVILKLVDK